jgi:amino acid permease
MAAQDEPTVAVEGEKGLKRTIKSRQLFMITLAGVIGTGLFLGSGQVISQAGPGGTIVTYIIGGLLLYLTMICLGELSTVMPVSGSFQAHATKFIGPATGFAVGWIYWESWAAFIGLEFLSAGIIMEYWFPSTPVWLWSGIFLVALFIANSLSARTFAEIEYWLACIKVLAVAVFITLGILAMFGIVGMAGEPAPFFSNFTNHGGLFPTGMTAIFAATMTVIYTFMGSEVMGVVAGETEDPKESVPRAVRTIVFRLIFLYLGTIVILIALIPWDKVGLKESPFVTVFDLIGIPYAAGIMNFVILIAILSVGNTGLYMCTRILWSLSQERMAPRIFGKTTKQGVPVAALIFTSLFGLLALASRRVAADTLFVFLISVSGIGGALCWMAIAFSHYRFRKQYIRDGGDVADLVYKAPGYPVTPIVALLINIGVFVAMAFDPTQRLSLLIGLITVAVCYGGYYLIIKPRTDKATATEPAA